MYRRVNSSFPELVYTGESIQGWDEDFAALWIEAIFVNKSPGARLDLLSWKVAFFFFVRGRRRQKTVHAQNKQKNSNNSCEIWGEIIAGQFCACSNSRRQTATW